MLIRSISGIRGLVNSDLTLKSCCDFAIAIRSIFADGDSGFVQAGAGIVFDSIAKNELNETEHKANAMLTALKEAIKWNS